MIEDIYNEAIEHYSKGNYKVYNPKTRETDKSKQPNLNEEDSKEAALNLLLYIYNEKEKNKENQDENHNFPKKKIKNYNTDKICIPLMKPERYAENFNFDELAKFFSSKTKLKIGEQIEVVREGRKKQTAEIFTPDILINEMLNKLPKEVWEGNKEFCDPAAGNGNFLVHILIRKIWEGHNSLDALKSIYGVDIMRNNVKECRLRLLKTVSIFGNVTEEHIKAVLTNIIHHDSLTYEFDFTPVTDKRTIKRWMNYASEERILDTLIIMNDN